MRSISPFVRHEINIRLKGSLIRVSFVSDHKDVLIGELHVQANHSDGIGWHQVSPDRVTSSTRGIWEEDDRG